jgi:hypothetical protein
MTKLRFLFWALLCILVVGGCTVEMNQPIATPVPETAPAVAPTSIFPVTPIPVTWDHLDLSGKLIYFGSSMDGDIIVSHLKMLDLETGDVATIFRIPGAWMYYATVAPDAKSLVMSYAPPRQASSASIRSLYVLPLDGSTEPQPLFLPPAATDRYIQAEWSPDGKYMYYVHYDQEEGQFYEEYEIFRMMYPNGEHEKVAKHAFWPRLSADSSRLVYVTLDPESGKNELFVSAADGTNPSKVPFSGPLPPEIIDAPVFSPDGRSILFSAPEASQSYQPNLFERLLGIQVAKAHNVPSDWWSIPVDGGVPTQLTNIQTINLFASLSPDQRYIASLSGEGVFVMDPDGSNLTQILLDSSLHGTLTWIP